MPLESCHMGICTLLKNGTDINLIRKIKGAQCTGWKKSSDTEGLFVHYVCPLTGNLYWKPSQKTELSEVQNRCFPYRLRACPQAPGALPTVNSIKTQGTTFCSWPASQLMQGGVNSWPSHNGGLVTSLEHSRWYFCKSQWRLVVLCTFQYGDKISSFIWCSGQLCSLLSLDELRAEAWRFLMTSTESKQQADLGKATSSFPVIL